MVKVKKHEVEQGMKVAVIVEEERICNKCGKTISSAECEGYPIANAMLPFKINFGYGSDFDGETWEWDLCPDCLLEFIKTFKYVPKGFMFDDPQYDE